jgi:hypothetical protein
MVVRRSCDEGRRLPAPRTSRALLCIAIAVVLVVPGGASAKRASGKTFTQTIEGSVALSESYWGALVWAWVPGANANEGYCGEGPIAHFLGLPNGTIGFHFEVDKRTRGRIFVLAPTSAYEDKNLDIYFYADRLKTMASGDSQPGAYRIEQYRGGGPGGEFGFVPKEAVDALVCLQSVHSRSVDGRGVAFTYEAGDGVEWPTKFEQRT